MGIKVATAEEMASIDRRTIEEYGIPSYCLMETAGSRVAEAMRERYHPLSRHRVALLAGKGNNGGDAFVVARYLSNLDAAVKVYTLFEPAEARGDPKVFLNALSNMGLEVVPIPTPEAFRSQKVALSTSSLFVDGIFGTGFMQPARGLAAEVIEFLNALHAEVVAIDIPSGLSANSGAIEGPFLRATLTITFGLPKRSHILYPGAAEVGELVVADIGIPQVAVEAEGIALSLLEEEDVRGALPKRSPFAHKGDCGHVLVVAGSAGKTGAACMTASSALRVGAGLVTLGIPASLNSLASAGALEAMTLPLPETEEASLDLSALEPILEASDRVQVLVLGPGLTIHQSTVALVHRLVQESPLPMVIDADGLNALAQRIEILSGREAPTLLTPHPGEMARLVGRSTGEVQGERVEVTQRLAREKGVFVALKGARTAVAEPGGRAWINPTGNSGMASAGMGDVLTGAVAGLLAQGMEPLDALLSGVYLHGLAGDLASETLGKRGYLASDVIAALPRALSHLGAG